MSCCCCNKCKTNLVAYNNTRLFSYSPGGKKSEFSLAGLKSRCQQGWFLLETLSKEPVSLPILASRGHLLSLVYSPFSILKAHLSNLRLHHHVAFSSSAVKSPSASLLQGYLWLHLRPAWIIQDNLPHLNILNLIMSEESLWSCKVTGSGD